MTAITIKKPPVTAEQVQAERDRRLEAGAVVTVAGYGDIPVQGRDRDMAVFPNLRDSALDLQDAGVTAAVIPFRDRDNGMHTLTPSQMVALIAEARAAAQAVYSASWDLIDADPTPQSYTADEHWP